MRLDLKQKKKLWNRLLNLFFANVSILTPWKHQEIFGFLVFSGGIKYGGINFLALAKNVLIQFRGSIIFQYFFANVY